MLSLSLIGFSPNVNSMSSADNLGGIGNIANTGNIVQLQLNIGRSWLYVCLVSAVYGLTTTFFVSLFAHHASFFWCGPLVVTVLSQHFYLELRRALVCSDTSIQQLFKTQAGYRLQLANGDQRAVQSTGRGFVSASLLIAEFQEGAETFGLTLLPDALSKQEYRRAKAHFLLYRPSSKATGSLAL